jgi:hypothetical protein
MAAKKAAAVKKQYMACYTYDVEFPSSIEEATDGYDDGDQIVVYEMVEVGRFEVITKPTLKPIK